MHNEHTGGITLQDELRVARAHLEDQARALDSARRENEELREQMASLQRAVDEQRREGDALRVQAEQRMQAEATLREEREALETLNRVNQMLSAELDPEKLVDALTDAATQLSGAQFGAFFYNVVGPGGESYMLYTLSGVPREKFARFPMPRNTAIFAPTFAGEGVVRLDDVTLDPRFGKSAPHYGMPAGHLPVRSYLAVPVISRTGAVLGGLFFGHASVGVFGERAEQLVLGLASQAAIAVDNARLYREANAAARQHEAILGQIADGVIVADAKGYIRFVNDAARRLHGVSELGVAIDGYANSYNLFTMDGSPYPSSELPLARAVERDEHVLQAEWRIRRPDGTEIIALGNAIPVRGDDGAKIGAVLTLSDVTSRRALERSLRISEERYRSLIDAGAQIVWTNNAEGEMVGEQPGWAAFTGQTPEEYLGYGWSNAVHPDDRAHTIELWRKAVDTRTVFLCEHRVRRHDGVYRDFSIRGVPVLETDSSIREWVGVHTDVTDRKGAEAERERLIAALELSNRELDQFAYVASHDLKAPLRGIANLSQWVEDDLGDAINDDARAKMRLIRGRVERLEGLINGILSYSRAGREQDGFEIIDVGKLLRETIELLSPPEAATIVTANPMPSVRAERVPLQQVLMNLIANAFRYSRRPDVRVEIGVRDVERHWEFWVKDNGPGIAPKFHERIWGVFQTLESRDLVEGTGIGLSVVKKIVETRGGRAWVESAEKQGATFYFTLPKHAVE